MDMARYVCQCIDSAGLSLEGNKRICDQSVNQIRRHLIIVLYSTMIVGMTIERDGGSVVGGGMV